MKKITIIGSTGTIGVPVTKELQKSGFELTLLVRNIEKAKNIFGESINYIKGDLNDIQLIKNSLKGSDGLYINISTKPEDKEGRFNPEIDGLNNIILAAKETEIKKIAYLSSFLARNYQGNWWVMNAKKESIKKIKNCGIPYTIFYPSNFMENFTSGMERNGKITVPIAKINNKAWWIAGEDFGKQVANSFKTENSINKEYAVQGPESFTMEEAARKYVLNYSKRKLTVGTMPFGLMKFLGYFIPQMNFLSKLMDIMLKNTETFESQNTWNELGTSTITISEFAKRIK